MFSNHALENHARSMALFDKDFIQDEHFALFKKMLELEKNANFYEDTKEDMISNSYPLNHQMETDAYYTNSEDKDIENPQKFMKSEESGQNDLLDIESNKKIKICGLCFSKFPSKFKIKMHKRTHMNGDLFLCMYCDFKDKRMNNTKCHIDKKHPEYG